MGYSEVSNTATAILIHCGGTIIMKVCRFRRVCQGASREKGSEVMQGW